jgi:hypothetical protein
MDPEIARNQNYDNHHANDREDVHSALLPFHDGAGRAFGLAPVECDDDGVVRDLLQADAVNAPLTPTRKLKPRGPAPFDRARAPGSRHRASSISQSMPRLPVLAVQFERIGGSASRQ